MSLLFLMEDLLYLTFDLRTSILSFQNKPVNTTSKIVIGRKNITKKVINIGRFILF